MHGLDAENDGMLDEAEKDYREVIRVDPGEELARVRLALVLALGKRFQSAMEQLDIVLDASPENLSALTLRGLLFLEKGQAAAAEKDLRRVLELTPTHAEAAMYLAHLALSKGERRQAAELLRLSTGSTSDPWVLRLAGKTYRSMGALKRARKCLEMSLRAEPESAKSLRILGWVLYDQGETALAKDAWSQAMRLDARAGADLARVLDREAAQAAAAGELEKARRLWNKALEADPEDNSARYHLSDRKNAPQGGEDK
ncbi:tetratricopeptide repeat protein [Desulfohalovibrio reitneri]|uniref:tetratricopeptide repeat protein n=1 Tax=Desulfohalovibrio reitneri TaxID=1307759 RepID=UPI0004A6F4CC|nr:tetratricopeptide repeat protein [Desulfohalovibrio reitneri]